MDGLVKVALIKSAKFDFTEVNIDGNSLFIGANGAGKTTLLRAILYFYTASSQGLGISSSKKISFSEYYFEYENSYIVYVYKKDDKYILVTVYKDSGIKFRFTLCNTLPNIKDIYIKNNIPLEKAELFLKLKELGTTSNIIVGGGKYKEILYSKNHSMRYFSLFEAKEYDGFVKTLSNIFINSKVDSDAIKKVIVSSLNIENSLDLSSISRGLERFNGFFEDIKSYETQLSSIKKIVSKLQEYEQTQVLLQDDISTLFNSKQKVIETNEEIQKDITLLAEQKQSIEKSIEYQYALYTKRKDKLNQTKGSLDGFIKTANEKKAYYDKANITTKLKRYENLSLEQSKLQDILAKKEFLTKEFSSIEQNHKYEQGRIENSANEETNKQKEKLFATKEKLSTHKSTIQAQEIAQLQKVEEHYANKLITLKEKQNSISLDIQEQKYKIEKISQSAYRFKEQQRLEEYKEQYKTISQAIQSNKNQINNLDTKLENLQNHYDRDKTYKENSFQKELKSIATQIQSTQSLLYPQTDSLISHIYKHTKNSAKYLYFLKEDILNSKINSKQVSFTSEASNIFELNFEELSIEQDVELKKLEALKKEHTKIEKRYKEDIQNLDKEFKKLESKIEKEKKQLNEQIKNAEVKKITLTTKVSNLQEQEKQGRSLFEDQKQKQIELIKKEQKKQEVQYTEYKEDEDKNLQKKQIENKKVKTSYTKEYNKIEQEYKAQIEDIENSIKDIEKQKVQKLQEQNKLYHEKLKTNNVDIDVLKNLENEEYKQKETIEDIKNSQELIYGYKKDKKEYIKHIESKTKKLKLLKEKIKELQDTYMVEEHKSKEEKEFIQQEIENKQKLYSDNQYQIQRVEEFENSTTFNDCIKWGVKYIASQDTEEITNILSRVDNLASRYRTYYTSIEKSLAKLTNIFANSLNIHRELDSLETAYKLKEFYENNKIENIKSLMSSNLNQILSTIIKEYDKLLDSQGKIESLVKRITKTFEEIKIGVIDTLALRYSKTNNKIIETFGAIKTENDENSFSLGFDSLFTSSEDNSRQIIELLKKLVDLIEFEKTKTIELEDSFILEFRVVENGNDSKYVQSLDMIGSNGTDVLVKSMVYVAMLHIFKSKITKKEIMFQVVLDEVGILSQRYLKELIEFANKKGILFVNGAPDEKLIGTYKRVSLISKIDKISVVKELIVQ